MRDVHLGPDRPGSREHAVTVHPAADRARRAVFAALALASGGALAMPMGAVLMNYMGHYVGTLAETSRASGADAAPRVASVGGDPRDQLRRDRRRAVRAAVVADSEVHVSTGRSARTLLAWAVRGLVLDVLLKTLLAPAWQRLLLRSVGW